jgi:hypothetical protein
MPLSPQQLDEAFTTLVGFACRRERCPQNGTHGTSSSVMLALRKQGRIRVLVYVHNWRAVEILTGEHAGKRTATPADKSQKPWRILDAVGEERRFGQTGPSAPSAPRTLTAADLRKL